MDMIIGGEKVGFESREAIPVINPATLEEIDRVPVATEGDLNRAIELARAGQARWGTAPMYERIEILRHFADLLEEKYLAIARAETAEMGKPISQSISEVKGSAETVRAFAEHARTLGGEVLPISNLPSAEKDLLLTVREPYGVAAAIVPFNYPVSSNILKTAPALLMGNSVIVKPASEAPLANILLTELMLEAGVPKDVLHIVTGSGAKIGRFLAVNPRINLLSLTGSTEVGIETCRNSSDNLKKVLLELGGNDPLIVLEDADLDYAASEAVIGRYGNAGQICCGSKRFIVHRSLKQAFVDKLIEKIKERRIGDPMDEKTNMGPLVSIKAAKKVEAQVDLTLNQGGKLLYGGHRFQETYFEPTVIEVTRDADVAKDMEIFGPVWPVITFDVAEEALEIANQTKYGLSSGVIGQDYRKLLKMAKGMRAGCCVMNGCGNYQTKDQGFGGFKMSGNAREGGHYALEEMSQFKTLVFRKAFEE